MNQSHTELAARLRGAAQEVRRKPMPLADFIPLLQQAADALESPERVQREVVAYTVAGQVRNWSRDFSMYKTQHYVRPVYATPHTAPAQDAQGVSAILDALRVGRVACEWAEKTAEVQQIAAAMEIAKSMLSATPSPQAEKQPLSLDEIQAWAVRRTSALGPEGITDPIAFLEEGARWAEARHGIVTKEST